MKSPLAERLRALPLKVKAAAITAVVFIAGIAVLTTHVVDSLRRDFESLIQHEQATAASFLARTLDAEIQLRLEALTVMAQQLARDSQFSGRQQQNYLLEQHVAAKIFKRGLYVVRNGVRIAESPLRGGIGSSYTATPHVDKVMKTGKPAVEVMFGRFAKRPVLVVAVPIVGPDGSVWGVLCGTEIVEPGSHFHLTDEVRNGKTGGFHVYALDYGIYAASTDPSRVLQQWPAPGRVPLLDQRLKGYLGPGRAVDSRGVDILTSAAMAPTPNWLVVAYLPTNEAYAPINAVITRVYSGAAIVALLVALITWLTLRRALEPLARAARTIATSGEDLCTLPVEGSGEIRMLLESFNRLQQRIAQQNEVIRQERDHLDAIVKARTAELVALTDSLKQEAARLDSILNTATDGIHIMDDDGLLVMANTAFLNMLGYDRDAVGKLHITDWDPAVDFMAVEKDVRGLIGPGQARTFETTHRRRDGSHIDVEITARNIMVDDKPLVFASSRDVTQSKADRQALAESHARLQERTHQVEALNVELSRRAYEAEAATRAKNLFIANMSHELRTPMQAVLGFNGMVRDRVEDPELRDFTVEVDTAARHLLQIINDILDLTKMEAGQIKLQHEDFDLVTVIEKVRSMIAVQAESKGVAVRTEIDASVPAELHGDPMRLTQILLNFANNAVKFTEKGSVTIAVKTRQQDHRSAVLRFEVTDTGMGIPEDVQKRLFANFVQADDSLSRRHGGTGLGLSIARQLTALMGGEVGCSSEPGKGSTFWMMARLQYARGQVTRVAAPDEQVVTMENREPVAAASATGTSAPTVNAELQQLMARLQELLAEDDIAVNRTMALAAPQLEAAFGAPAVNALRKAIERFDYPAALAALEQMRQG